MTTMQQELLAADLMTIDPVVVGVNAPVAEAERLIRVYHVSGLPVIDGAGALLGVVSQTDFVHLDNPEVRGLIPERPGGIRVGDVMSRPPVTVATTTPLLEAAATMRRERIHRLVVVDAAERPIGVLSAMDFVELYAEG